MEHLLPIPSSRYIPIALEDADHLTDMLDREYRQWYKETFGIEYLREPSRCAASVLAEFAYGLGITIYPHDTERVRRARIQNARKIISERGLWSTVKPLIDARTGADCFFSYLSDGGNDWILSADQFTDFGFWGALGCFDPIYKFDLRLSSGSEDADGLVGGRGIFLIDLGTRGATPQIIEEIKLDIIDQIPAYCKIYLGYTDDDKFVAYEGGEV
jgi:hypothetical protein